MRDHPPHQGVERGEFRTEDPELTAVGILAVIEGLASHANPGLANHPPAVARLIATTAERELGLPEGSLTPTQQS
ncbi:hypothetical protein [Kitasatospora cathayae]|uniref:Uncharacterized protein n=1 Tax=Kitasatospora cathayae TaxID=3004092 RepID=A0ABY7QJ37_9ACTN|nr:hypothetical protein [Kitasatospora sp. HUAS 3-15]WBP91911.1 hypothetical protein O1G21_06345 [Kitasatospora sp. HUAS 3-15]